ncbi:MAG: hypothetical protein RXO36_07365 [Candidatus Nanopusillus acidilobi]
MIAHHLYRSKKQDNPKQGKDHKPNVVLSNNHWYEVMKAIESGNFKRAIKIMALVKDTSNYVEQEKILFVSRYIEMYQVTSQKYFLAKALDIVERIMFYDANKFVH